jgi:energy-coupling factor transporter ATP-binding protein EcfA2
MNTKAIKPINGSLINNLSIAANETNVLIVTGAREVDRFVMSSKNNASDYRQVLLTTLIAEGTAVDSLWVYEPANSTVTAHRVQGDINANGLPTSLDSSISMPLTEAMTIFAALPMQNRVMLLVRATCLFQHSESLSEPDEFDILRQVDNHARNVGKNKLLVFAATADIPSIIPTRISQNPLVKKVYLPNTSNDERHFMAQQLAKNYRGQMEISDFVTEMVNQSNGMMLRDMVSIVKQMDNSQNYSIAEAASAIRCGDHDNPWADSINMREKISTLGSELSREISGQPVIQQIPERLKPAVVGLAAVADKNSSTQPRAIMVLAGPTGTGKTETVKVLNSHLYGSSAPMLRIDMGEFTDSHSKAKLVGSPPGYIGSEQDGIVIEFIKRTPSCVLLFDEVEKAHPDIWKMLLAALADGRITSGRGETVYLTNTILVFTTNLGMFEPDSQGVLQPTVTPSDSSDIVREKIISGIESYFKRIGSPETLGRLGGKHGVLVYDYIRQPELVLAKFIRNLTEACQRVRHLQITVEESLMQQLTQQYEEDPSVFALGGRGIMQLYKEHIELPLANYLFDHLNAQGQLLIGINGVRQA